MIGVAVVVVLSAGVSGLAGGTVTLCKTLFESASQKEGDAVPLSISYIYYIYYIYYILYIILRKAAKAHIRCGPV